MGCPRWQGETVLLVDAQRGRGRERAALVGLTTGIHKITTSGNQKKKGGANKNGLDAQSTDSR